MRAALLFVLLSASWDESLSTDQCLAPSDVGCFASPYRSPSGASLRVLNHSAGGSSSSRMSRAVCVELCCAQGFEAGALAGLENGTDCFCGASMGPYNIPVLPHSECAVPCPGDANETCGGKAGHRGARHHRLPRRACKACGEAGATTTTTATTRRRQCRKAVRPSRMHPLSGRRHVLHRESS